jgi:hypothetical protein
MTLFKISEAVIKFCVLWAMNGRCINSRFFEGLLPRKIFTSSPEEPLFLAGSSPKNRLPTNGKTHPLSTATLSSSRSFSPQPSEYVTILPQRVNLTHRDPFLTLFTFNSHQKCPRGLEKTFLPPTRLRNHVVSFSHLFQKPPGFLLRRRKVR